MELYCKHLYNVIIIIVKKRCSCNEENNLWIYNKKNATFCKLTLRVFDFLPPHAWLGIKTRYFACTRADEVAHEIFCAAFVPVGEFYRT